MNSKDKNYSTILRNSDQTFLSDDGTELFNILKETLSIASDKKDIVGDLVDWIRYDISGKLNKGYSKDDILNYLLKVASLKSINPEKWYNAQWHIEGIESDEMSISFTISEDEQN